MMHLNSTPPAAAPAPKKPCMRDMNELVTHHLPETVVKLVPLEELERRGAELVAEQPRFAEEVPLVMAYERRRRAQHKTLQVVGGHLRVLETTSQAYSHA